MKKARAGILLGLKIDCTPLTIVILYLIMIAGKSYYLISLLNVAASDVIDLLQFRRIYLRRTAERRKQSASFNSPTWPERAGARSPHAASRKSGALDTDRMSVWL